MGMETHLLGLDQVRILKVDLDMILQYFIWHSLNDRFKQQFVLITNNKNPTLAEIKANMFEANARYMEQNERIRKRKEPIVSKSSPSVLATNIPGRTSNAFKPCKLCKDGGNVPDHSMSRCPKYSNAADKIRRIQELNGCTRCSSLAHQRSDCKTKFNVKCKVCKCWHLEALCDGGTSQKSKTKAKDKVTRSESTPKPNECENGQALFI